MAEAEAHIAYGLEGWANPKICGLLAVTWLTKALKA
jgi:hypothetical protein